MAIATPISPSPELNAPFRSASEHVVYRGAKSARRVQVFVSMLLFFSYAYFYSGFGWNQNSRFDLTRALVERHTVRIDDFQANTGDKSIRQGHYYCDKAPGLSFAAAPVWATARAVVRATGKNPSSETAVKWGLYASTLITVSLPTVLALALLFSAAVEMGVSADGAAFALLALGLGTPLFCYAALFWGHAAAGAFLVFAFAAARKLNKPGCAHPFWLGLLVGLAAGYATLIEYPAAPIAALLAGYALLGLWRSAPASRISGATGISAGALACVAVLCIYNFAAFGSIWTISYEYNPDVAQMIGRGLFGVTYPKPAVLIQLLFNLSRGHGLLPLAPVLLGAVPGLVFMWKGSYKREALLLAAIPVYYLLFNSAYWDWTGGYTYGPRYLGAALPFLMPLVGMAWTAGRILTRVLLAALAMMGTALALIAVSTNTLVKSEWTYPLKHLARAFLSGKVPMDSFGHPTNAGLHLGLSGDMSVAPLVGLWLLAAVGGKLCGEYFRGAITNTR